MTIKRLTLMGRPGFALMPPICSTAKLTSTKAIQSVMFNLNVDAPERDQMAARRKNGSDGLSSR